MPRPSKPDPEPIETRAEKFVAEEQARYSECMDRARAAHDMTAQAFWQGEFALRMNTHRKLVRAHAGDIATTAEMIGKGDTSEEAEKAIKDAVKVLAEERVKHDAWYDRAVAPLKAPVLEMANIRESVMRSARQAETDAPLVHNGLGDAVRRIVESWPAATWQEDTGRVVITRDHGTGQAERAA